MKEFAATPSDRLGTLPPGVGLAIGSVAPDAELEDFHGKAVKLSDFLSQAPVLLAFYRGGWCPYCSFEIHDFVKSFPEYRARGITPVAISVDRPEESSKTQATFEIPFPVLSDPDLHAHEAFRVVHRADAEEAARLKGFGIDLERSSGKTHHSFAVPALFLVDAAGKIRWAHADPDYKVRPRTPQILAALDAAGFGPKR